MTDARPPHTSEIDIYRSAAILMKHHGEEAEMEAARRADAMLDKGDVAGQTVWIRILKAVRELRRSPSDCDVRH